MSTTTIAAIRDRMIAVIKALSPGLMSATPFEPHQEDRVDFAEWCEAHPTAALRRFSVRDTGSSLPPDVTNTDVEWRKVGFDIVLAYPVTNTYGDQNSLDRDDVMESDRVQVEQAVGIGGGANFSGSYPNATWSDTQTSTLRGEAVDLLVIRQEFGFWRDMT
jgi:hypothetical protein